MGLKLVGHDEVVKEDKRNSRKMYLPTDAICNRCGCINNSYWEDSCVLCSCKCGGRDFIHGKLSIDLRMLMDFNIEELRSLCEMCCVSVGSRSSMIIRILKHFHKGRFDKRVNEQLIKKIMMRNKRKFKFAVDIGNAVQKVKKEIKLELVKEEDVLDVDMDLTLEE